MRFYEDRTMKRKKIGALVVSFLLLQATIVFGDEYKIGEGDVLRISVWGNDKLSLSVRVRPDGMISIPALGDVLAAGKAPQELGSDLSKDMKKLERNPVVTVIVEEIQNNKVYVFGGGVKPGVYDLTQRTSLLQLLCRIGNAEESDVAVTSTNLSNADLKGALLIRESKVIKSDFYDLFLRGDVTQDILLKPDDTVFIPERKDRNVYVMGAVNEPKHIPYREGLTVMEAVLEAGGFTKFARMNSTVILRKNGDSHQRIDVKLDDLIDDGKLDQNIALKPGDYVVVKEGIF